MSVWVGFLRGVNLGRRQMKMAELRAACERLGLTQVKTIVASGNVRFEAGADTEAKLKDRLARGLAAAFDFKIEVILRRAEAIAAMIAAAPFAGVDPQADVALHVLLADAALTPEPALDALPDHIEVARQHAREIYFVAHRLPNGRYTEGLDRLDTMLPRGALVTMRNWNTMLKLLG